jgi:hypothetical protein
MEVFCIKDALADALFNGSKPFSDLTYTVKRINDTCPGDLPYPGIITLEVALEITTGIVIFASWLGPWTTYSPKLILSRLIDFKLPLLVLISQVPLPALELSARVISLLHIAASPVDSIGSYFFTLADCSDLLAQVRRHAVARESDCRALTLVLIAYSESDRRVSPENIER